MMLRHSYIERGRHQNVAAASMGLVRDDFGAQPIGAEQARGAVLLIRADRYDHGFAALKPRVDLGPRGKGKEHSGLLA